MTKKTINQITIFSIIIIAIAAGIAIISYTKSSKSPVISSNLSNNNSKLKVSTSFYPLEFITKEIGGSLVDVKNITPAGSEPHEYEPTQQQIIDIQSADLLLLNGAGLESWTSKIDQASSKPKTILDLSKNFQLSELEEDGQKVQDPHIWLSPNNYIKMTNLVSTSLQQNQSSQNQTIIQNNTKSLVSKLESLSNKYKTKLNPLNCKNTKFITNHDAFNYLAKDYGLEAISISGLSPEAEPTAKELTDLAKIIKLNDIRYVFTETIASPKLAETLAKEVGISTLEMNPLEGLSEEEITSGKNYINIMEKNLQNLAIALECK